MRLTSENFANREILLTSIENNVREKLAYIPERHPDMSVIEVGSTLVVNSSLPSDTFNTAFGGVINMTIARAVFHLFQKRKFPMAWWLGPSSQTRSTDKFLRGAGFCHQSNDIAMAANLSALPAYQYPDNIEIRKCEMEKDFHDFGEVLSSVFSLPLEADQVRKYYQKFHLVPPALRTKLSLFVGYVDGKPVSTSALFLTDCAGIFDISTRPEQRKKGYAKALLYRALLEAKLLGQEVAVLQASSDGLNIYKKFGFQQVGSFDVWSNVAALDVGHNAMTSDLVTC